jgi:hypothetical protein
MRKFVSGFLLPLVRGGAVRVARPLGLAGVERLVAAGTALEPEASRALGEARRLVASRLLPGLPPPPLDQVTLCLGAALHDLLALSHPGLEGPRAPIRHRAIASVALELASLGAPRSAREAVNRHSLLSRLPEIVRVDRTVHFWIGQQSFVGRRPPRRVMALPALRRVRIERTDRSWLREIGIPAVARPAFLALNVACPLGEALDPLRLEPPVAWGRILPVLRFPSLARAVAGRALEVGVERTGDALAEALYRFASFHDPPVGLSASAEGIAFALRFLAHIVWLDVLFGKRRPRRTAAAATAAEVPEDAGGGPGTDLAVMLTAAARTRASLIWPADVPDQGDVADAYRARLAQLAARAENHGLPRFPAALGIAELAVAPTTAA